MAVFGIAKKGLGKAFEAFQKGKGKSGAVEIKSVKPTTKVTKKGPKVQKRVEPPMARMEYTVGPFPGYKGGEKTIPIKEQVIGEKRSLREKRRK